VTKATRSRYFVVLTEIQVEQGPSPYLLPQLQLWHNSTTSTQCQSPIPTETTSGEPIKHGKEKHWSKGKGERTVLTVFLGSMISFRVTSL